MGVSSSESAKLCFLPIKFYYRYMITDMNMGLVISALHSKWWGPLDNLISHLNTGSFIHDSSCKLKTGSMD